MVRISNTQYTKNTLFVWVSQHSNGDSTDDESLGQDHSVRSTNGIDCCTGSAFLHFTLVMLVVLKLQTSPLTCWFLLSSNKEDFIGPWGCIGPQQLLSPFNMPTCWPQEFGIGICLDVCVCERKKAFIYNHRLIARKRKKTTLKRGAEHWNPGGLLPCGVWILGQSLYVGKVQIASGGL